FFVLAVLFFLLRFSQREKQIFTDQQFAPPAWQQACTLSGQDQEPVLPVIGKRFTNVPLTSSDTMLHLMTGPAEQTGGGESRRPVHISVEQKTVLRWAWAAADTENYQFWLRLELNNNRSIYYKASDAGPPGLYRGERLIAYKGKKYRDAEGRLRFLPSVTLLVPGPVSEWTEVRRFVADDYQQTYGDLPDDLHIKAITVGMLDESKRAVNELGLDFIEITRK
ncbi:MAG: hypothetical protein D3910_22800, partial [Candidatus Electrothrix sp. ATG2]|nr:hypothetical protein [Candidatus Electrothrix sp. ATG2]